ncbi:hypothetical protein QJS04_geneDACA003522 [Acorus gramineus]|uniref:DUF7653 domain-containing protein n=1 Tax=Acorus gramineus TaxID=55184 RepID=A0AAV9BM49_ACOGR|nr:hypothetical protein QJS04_geneDACA003522 [Acorus gramineus]
MRKFFSFRSSSTADQNTGPPNKENKYWEAPGETNKNKDFDLKPSKSQLESKSNPGPCLRRSLSCSSSTVHDLLRERDLNCLDGESRSPSSSSDSASQEVEGCLRSGKCTSDKKYLDRYIDGEQQQGRHSPSTRKDGCSAENKILSGSRRPPRVQSMAPASPSYGKTLVRSRSCREGKDSHHNLSNRDWTCRNSKPESPKRLSQLLLRKSMIKSRDFESKTVEDIYVDQTDMQPSFVTDNNVYKRSSSDLGISYYVSDAAPYGSTNRNQKLFLFQEDVDGDLLRKGREVEERAVLLSEEFEQEKLRKSGYSTSALRKLIGSVTEDRRKLCLDLSKQLRCRLAERSSAREALKQAKADLDATSWRLQKEKEEVHISLEKELDRRSSDWSLKQEKYEAEEQRLRERMRELAEQNVSLQREVSSIKGKEEEFGNRASNLELELNNLTIRMEELETENNNLQMTLIEWRERAQDAETDRGCVTISFKEIETENKELHKVVARLQKTYNEQEKTISGLRQGFSHEIVKQDSQQGDTILTKLQMEQVRLTGVELMLRKELDSSRFEIESLRQENINLLDRLQGSYSMVRLDQELCDRVECLQGQGLSLLEDIIQFCGKILEYLKSKPHKCSVANLLEEVHAGINETLLIEYDMRYRNGKRAMENLKRSLQKISQILHKKSEYVDCQSESSVCGASAQVKSQAKKGDVEFELKAETLLRETLQEKLWFKEVKLEQLEAEVASLVRIRDILKGEFQTEQDKVSRLNHDTKKLEFQVMKKDETMNQLQIQLQECTKELNVVKEKLPKVLNERDALWEEVKQYSENNMLLNCEVLSLKKKIEDLDEEVNMREGQITILRNSLNEPFDILYRPDSIEDF